MSGVELVEFDRDAPESCPAWPGWYATVHCWDVAEGAFGDAHYWDGQRWLDEDGDRADLPFGHYVPTKFEAFAEGKAFAEDHDLGW